MNAVARIGVAACLAGTGTGAGAATTLRVVALGTSLTASGGWTGPLGEAVAARCGTPATVVAVARAGANSRWLRAALGRVVAMGPGVVLIESAVNDAAVHRGVTPAEARANLAAIVGGLQRALPGTRPVVMAMNPVSGLRGLLRWRLDAYEDAALAEARALGAATIDFRPAWRRLSPAALAAAIPDGLHPTSEAASRIMVPPLAALLCREAPR